MPAPLPPPSRLIVALLGTAAWAAGLRGQAGEGVPPASPDPEAILPRVLPDERRAMEFRFARDRATEADRRLLRELASFADEEGRPRFALKTEREAHLAVAWACWLVGAEALKAGRPLVEAGAAGGMVRRELGARLDRYRGDHRGRTFTAWHRDRPAPAFGVDRSLAAGRRFGRWNADGESPSAPPPPASLALGTRLEPPFMGTPPASSAREAAFTDSALSRAAAMARLTEVDPFRWPSRITVDVPSASPPSSVASRAITAASSLPASLTLGAWLEPTTSVGMPSTSLAREAAFTDSTLSRDATMARLTEVDPFHWPSRLTVDVPSASPPSSVASRAITAASLSGYSVIFALAETALSLLTEEREPPPLSGLAVRVGATWASLEPPLSSPPFGDAPAWIYDDLSRQQTVRVGGTWADAAPAPPTLPFGAVPAWIYGDLARPRPAARQLGHQSARIESAWFAEIGARWSLLANDSFRRQSERPGDALHGLYVTQRWSRPAEHFGAAALAGAMDGRMLWRMYSRDENFLFLDLADPEELEFGRDEILRTLSPSRIASDSRLSQGLDFAWKLHRRTNASFPGFTRAARRADVSWTESARGLAALTAAAMREKVWDDALSLAEAQLEWDDATAEIWYSAAQSAWELRRTDAVEEYAIGLLNAFPDAPRRANAYWLLGLAAEHRRQPDARKRWWDRLIAEHPKTREAVEARQRLAAPPPRPAPPPPPAVHGDVDIF